MPYGVGHRCCYAHGGEIHDEVGEAKHYFTEGFGYAEQWRALFWGNGGECDAKDEGEECDLENLAFGYGLRNVFWEDVQKKILPVEVGGRGGDGGVRGFERNNEADAGVRDVDGDETDEEGEDGHYLEVDEGFDGDAADAFEVSVTGDAGYEGAEDERSDDCLDEAQEDVTQDARLDSEGGFVETEFGAGEHSEEDPRREGALAYGVEGETQDCGATERDGDCGARVEERQCGSGGIERAADQQYQAR